MNSKVYKLLSSVQLQVGEYDIVSIMVIILSLTILHVVALQQFTYYKVTVIWMRIFEFKYNL